MRIGVETFGPQVGSAYLIDPDDHADGNAPVEEEPDGRMRLRDPDPAAAGDMPVAFVDGVRRGDARLSISRPGGAMAVGVAGAHGVGAVVCEQGLPPRFDRLETTRLVVWGEGEHVALPDVPGGYAWECVSVPTAHPDAPLNALQERMREAERHLAESLCVAGMLTIIDGPLHYLRSSDRPVVGYVKTHHRAVLPRDEHRRVPDLRPGQRTSLFAKRAEIYACYLRLADPPPWGGPWTGIVRLDLPSATGVAAAAGAADNAALLLPRYASVAHRDSRAPVNLQPVGALESRLRHLLGDAGLAVRAIRAAASQATMDPGASSTAP